MRMTEIKYVTLNVLVKRITAKAVLLDLGEGFNDQWVPQSCISVASLADICEGFLGDVEVAEWFAEKEDLI